MKYEDKWSGICRIVEYRCSSSGSFGKRNSEHLGMNNRKWLGFFCLCSPCQKEGQLSFRPRSVLSASYSSQRVLEFLFHHGCQQVLIELLALLLGYLSSPPNRRSLLNTLFYRACSFSFQLGWSHVCKRQPRQDCAVLGPAHSRMCQPNHAGHQPSLQGNPP